MISLCSFSDLVPVSFTYLSQETLYQGESCMRRLRRTALESEVCDRDSK